MPPHRNHVEQRANGVPARQYVSDTHDHKPEVQVKDGPSLYDGLSLEVSEIIRASATLAQTVADMADCFSAKQTVSLKVNADMATKLAWSISIMSGHVSKVIAKHAARNPHE